jgi:hypothetical protein
LYDIAYRIEPSIRAPDSLIEEIKIKLSDNFSLYTILVCSYYLHWCELVEQRRRMVEQFMQPPPFEPLILMLERGDSITFSEHRFFIVGEFNIPYEHWLSAGTKKPLDLSKESLNQLDKIDPLQSTI